MVGGPHVLDLDTDGFDIRMPKKRGGNLYRNTMVDRGRGQTITEDVPIDYSLRAYVN